MNRYEILLQRVAKRVENHEYWFPLVSGIEDRLNALKLGKNFSKFHGQILALREDLRDALRILSGYRVYKKNGDKIVTDRLEQINRYLCEIESKIAEQE